MRAIYRHKRSCDIFAIEISESGHVLSTSGPLFSDDLYPKFLDYDEYWNSEDQAKLPDKVSDKTVREVSENCRVLKFETYSFDEI